MQNEKSLELKSECLKWRFLVVKSFSPFMEFSLKLVYKGSVKISKQEKLDIKLTKKHGSKDVLRL